MKKRKNKLTTLSYFVKRLKDSGFVVLKIFSAYAYSDSRKWTIMVDPGNASLYITCHENRSFKGDDMFELYDSGRHLSWRYFLKTDSMEIVIQRLIDLGISTDAASNEFYKYNKDNEHNKPTSNDS